MCLRSLMIKGNQGEIARKYNIVEKLLKMYIHERIY